MGVSWLSGRQMYLAQRVERSISIPEPSITRRSPQEFTRSRHESISTTGSTDSSTADLRRLLDMVTSEQASVLRSSISESVEHAKLSSSQSLKHRTGCTKFGMVS